MSEPLYCVVYQTREGWDYQGAPRTWDGTLAAVKRGFSIARVGAGALPIAVVRWEP